MYTKIQGGPIMKEGYEGKIPVGVKAVKTRVVEKSSGKFLGFLVNILSLVEEGSGESKIFCLVKNEDGTSGRFEYENVNLVPEILA